MKLLVLTISGYQDIELVSFVGVLNASGQWTTIDYWNPDGQTLVVGSNRIGAISAITGPVDADAYDAIFIPGGYACQALRTNSAALRLIGNFIALDKYVVAICDAPNALVDAGMQLDKQYVSYPIPTIATCATAHRQTGVKTWVDGKYITGDSPAASIELALVVTKVLFGAAAAAHTRAKVSGT